MRLIRKRKGNRIKEYDYSRAGYYFVTICAQNRMALFGTIVDEVMIPNHAGNMVERIWDELPAYYPGVEIDEFQIMPDHIHGIIILVGTGPRACPYNGQPQEVVPTMSLSDVVHRFKSLTTRKYINGVKNSHWAPFHRTLWQRSFYDHIIRNDKDLTRVREYIQNNPINWALGKKNLDNFTEST